MPLLEEQVAEVQLVQASTAEGEFQWRGSVEEIKAWESLLVGGEGQKVAPLAFALRLDDGEASSHLWLNVNYRHEGEAQLTLQGPNLARKDLDRVKRVIDERQKEATREGFDNVVFDVFTAVQAYLTEEPVDVGSPVVQTTPAEAETGEKTIAVDRNVKMSRVIFWTHHLKAPSKKRDMTAWCSELSLWGLVKSGYPGYLCFEGEEKDVQEMVRRIKALQWHAIMVKTEEPYLYEASITCNTMGEVRQEAVRHCLLAEGHKEQEAGAKIRTTMLEVESGKELVERLKAAAVPEDEYRLALNLRKG